MNGRYGSEDDSVFITPPILPGVRPEDVVVRLREDVRQEALAASGKVLASRRAMPPEALAALIEAIHSPTAGLTPAQAAVAAIEAYNESHPFDA